MSRAGNLNIQGSCRVEIIGGPAAQFVAGSNSGLFLSVTRTALGVFRLVTVEPLAMTVVPQDGSTLIQGQIESAFVGALVYDVIDATTIDVRTFTGAAPPVAADFPFALRVWQRFIG